MRDGMAVPRRGRVGRMGFGHAYPTDLVAVAVSHDDLVGLLDHLHPEIPKDIRHCLGPALIAWRRIALARQRNLAVLLHDFGGLRLQDWVRVIADQKLEIARTAR